MGVFICCFLLLGTSSIQPITANISIQVQEEQIKEDINYYIEKLDEIKEKYELLKCKKCYNLDFPIICDILFTIIFAYSLILEPIYLFVLNFYYILPLFLFNMLWLLYLPLESILVVLLVLFDNLGCSIPFPS
jgi:hypothetical protein